MLEPAEFALSKDEYRQLLTNFSADSVIPTIGNIARYHENKKTVLEELMGAVQKSAENVAFLKDLIINLKIDDAELIRLIRKCEQSRVRMIGATSQAINDSNNPRVLSASYSEFCGVVSELCCYVRRYG
jgi:predicted ATP-grasp superfamily ATP-dependent carboligase